MSALSRRGFIGAAAALAPGAAGAASGTLLPQTPPPPPVQNVQGAPDAEDRLTVETFVNGKGPFHFVVDTGADRSVICEDLAKSLALTPVDDVIVQGIARALPAPAVELDTLSMGRVMISAMPMPVLPRSWLGADGYLGLDVIDRRAVTFDFRNHKLSIDPSERGIKWISGAQEVMVRVNGSNGKLTAVNCNVDGTTAYAFVDSGAEASIGNSTLFRKLQQDSGAQYANDQVVQLLGVTGGSAQGRMTFVDRIKLGPVDFEHSMLIISDLQVFDVWGLADKPALFIGMNFLRQTSSVTIDYGRKELRFRLADLAIARA